MGSANPTLAVLSELARPGLAPGEQPVAAVKCTYNGATAPRTASLRGELANMDAAIGAEDVSTQYAIDPDSLIGFPAAAKMAVLVTNQRVLVWSTGITGKPQKVAGIVPGTAVANVLHGTVTFGPLVQIVMKSTAIVDLEVAKGEDVDAFVGAIRALAVPQIESA